MALPFQLLRLARPHQWAKSVFVLVGPLYGLRDMQGRDWREVVTQGLLAAGVFALASSACYAFNDLRDAPRDRVHPRKRGRPIAAGLVSPGQAWALVVVLLAGAAGLGAMLDAGVRLTTLAVVALYVANVFAYSLTLKNRVIADVLSLSMGFVLRVIGGCCAVGIWPTTWLLNCTMFLAMFLAFGKRLGERRTAEASGYGADEARAVQAKYTDNLLRMTVVVTAVAALLTYAAYVQSRQSDFALVALGGLSPGFNWLWLTLLPATYALLRSMVLIERGVYDDPTEMFLKDRALAGAGLVFAALTGGVMLLHAGA
jgi:4-hydroxybenzoate polyprenyltransferase